MCTSLCKLVASFKFGSSGSAFYPMLSTHHLRPDETTRYKLGMLIRPSISFPAASWNALREWTVINAGEDRFTQSKKKEIRLAISLSYWISIIGTMSCKAIEIYAMGDLPQRINAYQDLVKLYLFS
ncbi:unnamed protein product [Albugo candida]|uniref:Uncharacterized protein n=1 Tax=Albugo candida TaxID=65357 RepID=A0A024FTA1_9STRA|nr:unnamed protein product [Albugo candida]|eukprot:CCI10325.1 unnamed protein product [Albugo candida]